MSKERYLVASDWCKTE